MELHGMPTMMVGGASGICRASAQRIVAGGGTVAIVDREESAGAEVAAELGGSWHLVNVLDYEGTELVINEVVETLGCLDALVNTPGGGKAGRTVSKTGPNSLADFQAVVDLNLIATFNVNRLSAWHMSKNVPDEDEERVVMINTASIAAFEGQIGQIAHTASKAAVAGMTLTMARDLGSLGIRVNTIAPSLFETGLAARVTEDRAANMTKDAAFPRRMGRPDE
jgi:NAD(P)-dependent dehydrogenase (short-subunit alcohol dehydrogenase family)